MNEETLEVNIAPVLGEPKPVKKKRRWWVFVIDAVCIAAFAVTLAVSANAIYLSSAYDLPFFVNGMSMYPTFNLDGERRTNSGMRQLRWNDGGNVVGDIVDYGYAKGDERPGWRNELNRLDIVVTYYPSDYETDGTGAYRRDENGALILRSGAKSKIKRIIGLPKETVTWTSCPDDGEDHNRIWGKTLIEKPGQEPFVLNPLYKVSDYPGASEGGYAFPTGSHTWHLGENEYVVLGDNRGYSTDCYNSVSSKCFTILNEMITGKAFLVIGKRELIASSDGSLTPKDGWGHLFVPWTYRRVG